MDRGGAEAGSYEAVAMVHVKEEDALYKGRAEEQSGGEEIASRYISEGEKARHVASLCIDLCGEGRRRAGLGCCKVGTLRPVPISVPQRHLDIFAGLLTISVMLFLSWSLISHPAWEGC